MCNLVRAKVAPFVSWDDVTGLEETHLQGAVTYRRDKLVLALVGRSVMAVGWDLPFLRVAFPCGWIGLLMVSGQLDFFSGSWLSPEQRSRSPLAPYSESLALAQGHFYHVL